MSSKGESKLGSATRLDSLRVVVTSKYVKVEEIRITAMIIIAKRIFPIPAFPAWRHHRKPVDMDPAYGSEI